MKISSFPSKQQLLLSFLFSFSLLQAQLISPRPGCGTKTPSAEWDIWFNEKVKAYKATEISRKVPPVTITIPVIVHVLHGGQNPGIYPNISGAQINSQISVLNDDFNGNGYNIASLAATGFSAVGAATTNINFCLAQQDPQGNQLAEAGIDRINFQANGWANPNTYGSANTFQSFMDGTVKPATIWDPTQYFNIWVSDVNPTAYLLGYATFPAGAGLTGIAFNTGSAASDGIWIWSRAFGNVGVLDATYNKGRTAVHETGHWLGLRHIGGDANNPAGDCNATDYCADTPPQKGGFSGGSNGQNFGSPSYPLHLGVCSSPYGDMFMNFMDYCDDGALNMFTPDQNTRMQTALLNGVFRSQLGASSMSLCSGLPAIEFSENQTGCAEGSAPLDFQTSALATSAYSWSAIPSNGVLFFPTASSASPAISFPSPGTYTIMVTASNSIGVSTSTTEVAAALCTGLHSSALPLSDFEVFPSPANTSLQVRLPVAILNSEVTLSISEVTGKVIYQQTSEVNRDGLIFADLANLEEGLYFITITTAGQSACKRVIVSH